MRRRSPTTLPADVARELAALDAALAGEPVAADLTDLGALALTLRDDRPVPPPAFAARLDDRAAAGFPAPAGDRRGPARSRRTWAGAGLLASGVAAAVLAVSLAGGGGTDGPTADRPVVAQAPALDATQAPVDAAGAATSPAAKRAPQAPAAPSQLESSVTAPIVVPSTPAPPVGAVTGGATRSVERGASLRLATTPKQLDDVVSGVVRVTDVAGGFVMSSSVDARPGIGGGAAFDLRIPSARLQSALAQLSQLAHVRSRTQSSFDVTAQVGSAAGRIASLRAARRSVLRQLAAAPGEAAAAVLRARLRSIEARLAQAKAVRADLRRRTTYSAVAVQVVTERRQAGGAGGGGWTPGDALHDAGRVLGVVLGALLVGLAALLPVALLAAVLIPLARAARRRRREHLLDGT